MPGDQIFLNYAPAQGIADEIKTLSTEVENLLETEINTEVNSLLAEWEGSAAEGFMSEYNRLKARFNEFYASILNISQTIKSASDEINGTDINMAG